MNFDKISLTLAVFIPLAGMVGVLLTPKKNEVVAKSIALGTAIATLGVGIAILVRYNIGQEGLQFGRNKAWIPLINARYEIGLDGIGLPMLILSMLITLSVIIYSWDHFPDPRTPKAFLAMTLLLEVGMNGTFVAQDLILFFVFFEIVLLPMFFLIGVWGGSNRKYASLKFFLFTLFGSAMMLLGFLALFFKGGHTFSIPELTAMAQSGQLNIAKTTGLIIFGGLFLGFAIKVPMFPFHTWLPDAHTEAPTQGSVILAAILLKLGTYGFIKIAIPILPKAFTSWSPYIGGLAVIGIIYGSLCCLAQSDMKRLIAFSSVAHMGFVMLAISTGTEFGMNAALFGMFAHGLITGMLFFIGGSVQHRYHTREMSRLGGMLKQIPKMGWLFGLCCMASLGLPGLAGFWGEFPAVLSAFSPAPGLSVPLFRFYMVVAAVGTVLAAAYLLWMFQRVAFGEVNDEFKDKEIHDVHISEWLAWTPILIPIFIFGVYPDLLFKYFATPVAALFGA
ncbi:MAG: NADH-quinone oxidoreductase subunit M [Acidimicrobiia bacterium]